MLFNSYTSKDVYVLLKQLTYRHDYQLGTGIGEVWKTIIAKGDITESLIRRYGVSPTTVLDIIMAQVFFSHP